MYTLNSILSIIIDLWQIILDDHVRHICFGRNANLGNTRNGPLLSLVPEVHPGDQVAHFHPRFGDHVRREADDYIRHASEKRVDRRLWRRLFRGGLVLRHQRLQELEAFRSLSAQLFQQLVCQFPLFGSNVIRDLDIIVCRLCGKIDLGRIIVLKILEEVESFIVVFRFAVFGRFGESSVVVSDLSPFGFALVG